MCMNVQAFHDKSIRFGIVYLPSMKSQIKLPFFTVYSMFPKDVAPYHLLRFQCS